MNQSQLEAIKVFITTEINVKTLEVYRLLSPHDGKEAKRIDSCLQDVGNRIVEGLKSLNVEPNDPKSAVIDPEKELDPAADARDNDRPAETSPIDGDGVDAGAAIDNQEPSTDQDAEADGIQAPIGGGSLETSTQPETVLVQKVKAWISKTGTPNAEVARLAGVSEATLYNILSGKNPSKTTRNKLLKAISQAQDAGKAIK